MSMSVPTSVSDAASKTCLPQNSLFPLWRDGFEAWHIWVFIVGLVGGNVGLVLGGVLDRPTPGKLSLEELLTPSNPVFSLMLITTVILFAKTHAVMWLQVVMGSRNNSFSKNVWDVNTGSSSMASKTTEEDLVKKTMHHIHENDLENIPLTLTLHLLLVLVQPSLLTAQVIFLTYTIARLLHTLWYAWYGSHEVRAMIFSLNCFANYAACTQILAACGYL